MNLLIVRQTAMKDLEGSFVKKRNIQREPSQKLTLVFLAAALGMCLFGAVQGDMGAVFTKAARICMECIGLG